MEISCVAFFGCACGQPGDAHVDAARQVAKVVAASGRCVTNGGGPGVMLAATLGAKEARGKTRVVYYKPKLATSFEGKATANFGDEQSEEANYILRTKKLLELGDAYIIFNGGTGTISEFAMAWGVARLYFGHHKPLMLYGEFWKHLVDDFREHMLIRKEETEVYTIVNSPDDVLRALESYERILAKNRHEHKNTDCGDECFLLL